MGSIRRLNSRTMVDLPEPDSPMMTKISPRLTEKLASNTPTTCPVFWKISFLSAPLRNISIASSGRGPNTLKMFFTERISSA
ncbi:hypothetical protein D3C78_1127300 [compost metagenome]